MLRQHGTRLEGLEASLGEVLARLDRTADAQAAFSNEIRMFPRHIDAYLGLARLYAASGQDVAAETTVRELLDTFPTPDAYSGASRLWSELGQRSRADAIRSEARARFRADVSLTLLGRDRPR
jgi:tetratricopeptide (TPR) repeat protein